MGSKQAKKSAQRTSSKNKKKRNVGKATAVPATTVSKNKYRGLFEATPVSLWEEDFSKVKQFIDQLRHQGITDFRSYFDTHPEEVTRCIELIKIKDVNQATLQLYKAPDKEILLANLGKVLGPDSLSAVKEQLITIAENKTTFAAEGINYTLEGEKIDIVIRWSVSPGFEDTLSQVIVSILNVTNQKQAERQLRLQAAALESAANAILIADEQSNIIWVNPAYTKLTGYTLDDIVKKHVSSLIPKRDRKGLLQEIAEVLSSGKTWHGEDLINQRKDGTLYYQDVTITPAKDAADQIVNYVAIVEDITERKQIELQLRNQLQEEELLRQIAAISSSPEQLQEDLSLICEKLAHFYKVPSVSFTLLDKTAMLADILGKYVDQANSDEDISVIPLPNIAPLDSLTQQTAVKFIANVQEAAEFAEIRDILQTFSNHSVLFVPIQVQVIPPLQGILAFDTIEPHTFSQNDIEFIEQVGAHINQILQRIHTEQTLQKQRNFANQIMNHMGQGLVVLQADLTIDYCNPAFANLIGYTEEALLGQSLAKFIKEDVKQAFSPTKTESQSQKFVREFELVKANRRIVNILVTAVPQIGEFSDSGFVCVVTDLSAQKKIENTLAQARDKALEASRLKSEFLANMSHEIRTPLNAVIGMTSLLLDSPLTAEQQDYAQTVHSSGEILLSLVNDILDFSKIEAGKLEIEKRPFVVRSCVEEALDVVVNKAAEKGLELAYIIDDTIPNDIVGDANRVRQILVNLLNNAIKFTDYGEVVLSISLGKEIKTEDGVDVILHFSITDTGTGIPPENLNRLFKSFSQVDASTTRKYGGSGLGLAISKQLVEMMGGKIWVKSDYGRGSTFHFTIAARAIPSRRHVYTQQSLAQLKNKRLLIVDDNYTNCKILLRQATSWGMIPTAALSGPEALVLLEQGEQFDLAILDMQMPRMDGLMLALEIRKLRSEQALPLVMLSSIGEQDRLKSSAYFAAYLTKPVKQQKLFDNLLSILSKTAVPTESIVNKLDVDSQMGQKHPLRILLAEDNLINQKVTVRLLERMGYRADVANDGLEVLVALQTHLYDVVLMDVQMPHMDGVIVTQQIRDIWPADKQPHIVAMTANALTGDREKYLVSGMDEYLSKPVKIQELAAVLENVKPLSANSQE